MKRENIFKAIVQIIMIILLSNLCKAEYDVYSLGVSYTVDCEYIQSFAEEAGIKLKAGSCYKGNMRSQARAGKDQEPYSELSSGTVDAFIMTAQMPYKYTEPESEACIKMSKVLLENNPCARIYIHDYWTVVRPSSLALYTEYHGWDNVNAHHLGGIKTISLMANKLNHKVYNIPVGIAIQLLREKIEQDKLEGYKNTDELLVDSLNLSEIGRYVQACMSFCSAYQYDVRTLPGQATNIRGREIKFSTNDAKIIHDIIYETVRNTPYSGWYKNEPESLDDYLKHIEEGLRNWESFDKLYPASGTGTFIGDNGVQWNCTNIRSNKILETLTDAYVEMSRNSSLSTTIQGGIADLHFVVFRGSEIEVFIDGNSMGIFEPENLDGWDDCYYKIANINKTTDVTIKFICKNNESKIDNIFWTIPLCN